MTLVALLGVWSSVAVLSAFASGEEQQPEQRARFQPRHIVIEIADIAPPAEPLDDDRERKRSLVWLAVYVIAGILAIGVVLIAGVLAWGAKMRRQARTNRLEPRPHDPLWYLKTGKRKPNQPGPPRTNPPDATSDSENPST